MNYLKNLLITIAILLITTIIFGSLSYNNIFSDKTLIIIQFISLFIIIFIESFYLGKSKDKKGYIEGIINGSIISLFFLIINIIFKKKISIYKIIIYFIIIIISMIGSILGINKKMKD